MPERTCDDLTLKDGFTLRGENTHYTEEDYLKSGSYFYGKNIDRILRIEDSLITVSKKGVQSHTIDSVVKEGGTTYEGKDTSGCPDPESINVFYVSEDPETCSTIKFFCKESQEIFNNECGCGCKE